MQVVNSQDSLHHRSIGCQHEVVLVHACRVITLGFKHTGYAKGDGAETDDAPDRVFAACEKSVCHSLTDEADLCAGFDVFVGEHLAVGNTQPPDVHVFLTNAIEGRRRVVISVNELAGSVYTRTYGSNVFGFGFQFVVVFEFEGLHLVGVLPGTSGPAVLAGPYHNHVRAHFGYLCLYASLGALTDGQHRDDRSHADDDAQHGQQ